MKNEMQRIKKPLKLINKTTAIKVETRNTLPTREKRN